MDGSPSLIQIIALIVLVVVVLYFTVFKELSGRGILPGQKKLLSTGVSARAKVVKAEPTGSYFGGKTNTHELQEVAIVFEVQPPNGEVYTVNTTRAIPTKGRSNPFYAGREFEVKIDPVNPKKIAIVGFDGNS